MARTFVAVTAGSGTKLATVNYTDGADVKNDEVMVLGEQQATPTYMVNSVNTGPISIATLNAHVVQVMAGATNRVRIRRIELYQQAMATAAAIGQIYIVRLTTAGTGGSNLGGPVILDPASGAAGATAMTLPTAKGTEGAFIHAASVYWMQTVGASTPLPAPSLVIDFDRPRSNPLIIAAGTANGIAIKVGSAIAAATVNFNIWIDESPY